MSERADDDVTRRTLLAAERTWWPGGARASQPTAAVAVGGVVPELVDSGRTPYVMLGVGYAGLAAAVFAAAALRRRQVQRALERGEYSLGDRGVVALTMVAMILSLATLVVIVVQG